MDLHEALSAVGWFVAVTGGLFVVFTLVVSYTRFEHLTRLAAAGHSAVDPHDAFQLAISRALGTAHRVPEPFCVCIAYSSRAVDSLAGIKVLRGMLRSEDEVFPLSDNRFGLLIRARRKHAKIIGERLGRGWQTAFARESSVLVIGASSCPENGERVVELLTAAEAALEQAAQTPVTFFALAPPNQPETETAQAEGTPSAPSKYVDPLTGLLKSEFMYTAVQKYIAVRRRKNEPVSLLLVDVDHLDRYNSHYGREAGDAILKTIGQIIEKTFRETDLTARLSGEEFLVAAGCRPAAALTAGQRLVAKVKRTAIPFGRENLHITVKVGVAGFPDHGGHPRFLLEKADAAVSAARARGGNTCVLYDVSMQKPAKPSVQDRF